MNLTDELFNQITDTINVVGRDEPRVQDRRQPRVKLSSHVSVIPWADPSATMNVRVRDISVGGAGIFHTDRIGLDEQIVIRFPVRDNKTVLILGTVVYWEPLAEKLFGIGVQFERIVDEAEISDQAHRTVRNQLNQIGVVARLTGAFARTWRIAS
jgi:hypothetical protein